MRINSNDQIAGIPILRVRWLFRKTGSNSIRATTAALDLKVSHEQAETLIKELCRKGYLEADGTIDGESAWRLSIAGGAFAMASAAPPVRRETAERALNELLERVRIVNADPEFLYRVREVKVFGSYLGDSDRIGDVDVALDIERKESDPERFRELTEIRLGEAWVDGRRFSSEWERHNWPYTEVVLYLKSRSRTLSLHAADEPENLGAESKTVFQAR